MAKTKLVILIVVLSVAVVATVTGVSVAYWVGAEGDSEIAPQADTIDWSYWSKYFIYAPVVENGNPVGYKIVGFEGTLEENVVIPRYATGGRLLNADGTISTDRITETGPKAAVWYVGSSTFANTTDKAIPVTITLPTTVDVEPGAFAGCTNLTTIRVVSVMYDNQMEIGSQTFAGCFNVVKLVAADNINFTVDGTGVTYDVFLSKTGLPTDLKRFAK